MNPSTIKIENIAQIREAAITFGDLTVLVGPQATGKSIALEFLKLIVDRASVRTRLRQYGVEWGRDTSRFLDAFLGEGMHAVWEQGRSHLSVDGKAIDLSSLIQRGGRRSGPSVFFIPAQRVLTLREGWPRPFSDYGPGDPFTVRDFSDDLRLLMEREFSGNEILFPKTNRLKSEIRSLLADAVFHGFGLNIDTKRPQKRLVLEAQGSRGDPLPFMVWSAGQREFVPLLLGLYWLLPAAKTPRRGDIDLVVIEELEMGLHPKAINVVLLLVLELLWRGYRVCLSTHSTQVLDVVWALRTIQANNGTSRDVLDLFGCKKTDPMTKVAEAALEKSTRVVLFDTSGETRDISGLDPGAEDAREAGWGGLTEFSGHVGDVVARVVNRRELDKILRAEKRG